MNGRRVTIVLTIPLVAGATWWFSSRSPKRSDVGAATAPQADLPVVSPVPTSQVAATRSAQTSYKVPAGGAYQGLEDPRWKWWNTMKKVDPSFEWKIPIEFYGRVVDQDSAPVADAVIRYGWNDVDGNHERFMRTGSDGRFAIEALHGKHLTVDVSKDGYHVVKQNAHSFEYAAFFEPIYHRPERGNPVTFRLVRKLDAEPVIARRAAERLAYDGPSYYDLERGTLTQQRPPGPALQLQFERSESPQGQPFDWKWKVEAVNAGLVETEEEIAQMAPEEGYVSAWEASLVASAKNFRKTGHVRFYVRTVDNRFARVDVEVAHPNSRDVGPRVTVNSVLNPSGSRNVDHQSSHHTPAR